MSIQFFLLLFFFLRISPINPESLSEMDGT